VGKVSVGEKVMVGVLELVLLVVAVVSPTLPP